MRIDIINPKATKLLREKSSTKSNLSPPSPRKLLQLIYQNFEIVGIWGGGFYHLTI